MLIHICLNLFMAQKVEDITGYILTQTRQHHGTTIHGTTPVLVTMKSCEVLACECGKVTLRWFAGKSTLVQQTNFSTKKYMDVCAVQCTDVYYTVHIWVRTIHHRDTCAWSVYSKCSVECDCLHFTPVKYKQSRGEELRRSSVSTSMSGVV